MTPEFGGSYAFVNCKVVGWEYTEKTKCVYIYIYIHALTSGCRFRSQYAIENQQAESKCLIKIICIWGIFTTIQFGIFCSLKSEHRN